MANRRTRMLRIDRVLDQTRNLSRPSRLAAAVLVVAALPLVYFATAARPGWAQQPTQTGITSTTCGGDPAFARWLTEDVAYIITNQERAAFVGLNSAPECSQFVEQFWQRRDPTPGTPENEYKVEHYRRIGFANAHFASPRTPGWQTDRGRVYITHGPPDEIEAHREGAGTGGADPYQQWLYHHTGASTGDILFEFVDTARNGEYRITFMGDGRTSERGPVVFGPIGGLYVQVNKDRTLFITTPVGHSAMAVSGGIVDRNGALVQRFEDVTRAPMYGKGISAPLAAGTYTLHLQVGPEDRSIVFEVK